MTTGLTLLAPACGPSELARCRALAADGAVGVSCRRAGPMLEAGMLPLVLEVERLAAVLEAWPAGTWQLLELALPAGPRRAAVRRRAEECAALSGRAPVLGYAVEHVLGRLPGSPAFDDPEGPAVQLVRDAVLAAVTGDLLTHAELHALRRPLHALTG